MTKGKWFRINEAKERKEKNHMGEKMIKKNYLQKERDSDMLMYEVTEIFAQDGRWWTEGE